MIEQLNDTHIITCDKERCRAVERLTIQPTSTIRTAGTRERLRSLGWVSHKPGDWCPDHARLTDED